MPEFDYSQPSAYFVTILTRDRKPLFGQIVHGEMVLNGMGKMVCSLWAGIPEHFQNVELGEYVIMPNHIHGIIIITVEATPVINVAARHVVKTVDATHGRNVAARHAVPSQEGAIEKFGKPVPASLSTILRSFKSATTKRFREISINHEDSLWQRSFYDHVIRNDRDHQAINDYIITNPENWEKDEENLKE